MIIEGYKEFIRMDKTVVSTTEFAGNKGSKTEAGNTIPETVIRDMILAEKSKGPFRMEVKFIALDDGYILPLANASEVLDKLIVILGNPWHLSGIEMFCSCLLSRNGMTKPEIVKASGLTIGEVNGAIRRSYDKSEIHTIVLFSQAFILLNPDYVLPVDLKGNF
jgi:hypothetical protein